jgi:transposase InsO family protein
MIYRQIHELAADGFPVAVICRCLGVSRSGFYDWRSRGPSARQSADRALMTMITEIHTMSRYSYGAPRVHAELRLGLGVRCGRKRVARLMRLAGLAGICHRRKRRGDRPTSAAHEDLVCRRFVADRPNMLWVTDITQHPTRDGTVYCCAVLDVFSPMIVGWSIADHMRAELVVDALQMACWRSQPPPGTICHSDRGAQYTSWVFGHRLRQAGLLGSMGWVASSVDNTMIESFWSTMQRELLDTMRSDTKHQLSQAIFEWIEAWYTPRRRHTSIGDCSPVAYEHHTVGDAESAA